MLDGAEVSRTHGSPTRSYPILIRVKAGAMRSGRPGTAWQLRFYRF